jgi:thiamine pyrophosphate-dependent acetolactate synthase large subunit-like protein
MIAAQGIIEVFKRRNVEQIFHLPGINTLPLNRCFFEQNLHIYLGRHESSCAFMADGYAKTSGKPGVVIVTAGPGLGNVVSPCMEAYGNDTPLFILHVDTDRDKTGKGVLHEIAEPENIFKHFTKNTYCALRAEDVIPVMDDAFRTVLSGRPGPVVVSVPYGLLEKPLAARCDHAYVDSPADADPDLSGLEKALSATNRPVIIGGRGAMVEGVGRTLAALCEASSVPFLSTTSGKGVLREDSPFAFGNIMQKGVVKEMLASADTVIAVGTRLRDADARRRGVKIRGVIHIDRDDKWMGKNYPTTAKITGSIEKAVRGLAALLRGKVFDWDLGALQQARKKEQSGLPEQSAGFWTISLLRQVIPEETITVWDLNLLAYWAEYYFPVYHQNTFLTPRGVSPIFFALPESVGAKLGNPGRPCLAVCGDGGILPTIHDLATIQQYNIPLVLLIYNNNGFGVLEDYMVAGYNIRDAMSLRNPDFVKIARAFGIKARKASHPAALRDIFLRHISWTEPFIIELCHPLFPPPWRLPR